MELTNVWLLFSIQLRSTRRLIAKRAQQEWNPTLQVSYARISFAQRTKRLVSANACEACPIGKINAAGNSASGNDTNCEDIICTSDLTPSTLTNSSIGCVFGAVTGTYGGCACVCSNGFTGQFCDECALGFGSDGSDCLACVSPFASDTSGLEACQVQTCKVNKRLASVFDTTTLDEAVNCEHCPAGHGIR